MKYDVLTSKRPFKYLPGQMLPCLTRSSLQKKLQDIPYFTPGTGMADTVYGSATLELTNIGHNHCVPERRRVISNQQDSIFFSSLTKHGNKLTDWPTVYLVVFVNLNQSDEIDSHEYECLILDL